MFINSMKYIAGYIMLTLGGKKDISEKDLTDFMTAAEATVDAAQVKAVVEALKGKNLSELSVKGLAKIGNLSAGAASAAAPAKTEAKKEEKKEKKEEKKVEVVEEDMDLGGMFD